MEMMLFLISLIAILFFLLWLDERSTAKMWKELYFKMCDRHFKKKEEMYEWEDSGSIIVYEDAEYEDDYDDEDWWKKGKRPYGEP